MKRAVLSIILGSLALAPMAFGDIADYMLNVNGTTYCPAKPEPGSPGLCSNFGGLAAVPGLVSSLDTTFPESGTGTGLGTVNIAYNPGPGAYYVNLWLFENLVPAVALDEYGAAFNSPATGESWQIDVPDSTYSGELGTAGAGTIVGNTAANTLANANFVPGTDSNADTTSCGFFTVGPPADPNCNDYTSMALGFGFTLTSGEQELLSFKVSTTPPASGFYLEQVAPVDPSNDTEVDYFFSGTATAGAIGPPPPPPPPPTVPEPSSWILLGSVAVVLGVAFRRRRAAI